MGIFQLWIATHYYSHSLLKHQKLFQRHSCLLLLSHTPFYHPKISRTPAATKKDTPAASILLPPSSHALSRQQAPRAR
jgi:hypothetical protein